MQCQPEALVGSRCLLDFSSTPMASVGLQIELGPQCTLHHRAHHWHPLQVMVQAGAHVKEEVCRALVVLVSNAPELHAYAVRQMYTALKTNREQLALSLLMVTTWFLGASGRLGATPACLQLCHRPLPDSLAHELCGSRAGPLTRASQSVALCTLSLMLARHQCWTHIMYKFRCRTALTHRQVSTAS